MQGQFTHPLVVRAKLEIASACHAHGKVPSHSVITEFSDTEAMRLAARRASREFGFTRIELACRKFDEVAVQGVAVLALEQQVD